MQNRTPWLRLAVALAVLAGFVPAIAQNNQSLGETDIRTIFADKPFIRDMVIPEDMIVSQFPGVSGGGLARNTTGATIAADRVVYVSGTAVDPTSGVTLPLITLASQSGATGERTRGIYVTVESIATATNGRIALRALSSTAPIDLAAATVGDPVYLGLTGLPTLTQASGANMSQEVGSVGVVATDVIAWNLAASENETHTHVDQSQGGQLALSAAGTAGSITADAAGRALFADDFLTSTETSTAAAGGKFAADAITEAGVDHLFADDSWNAEDFVVGAGGIVDAGAFDEPNVDHLFADDSFNAEDFVAGAGGVFAPNCLDQPNLASLVGDDAFTTAEFAAGAGGKFAAGALNNAGIANLVADDGFTTVEFAAGAGGKFAAGALNNAGLANLVADDGFTTVEFGAAAGGKFTAGALDEAGAANLFADDSFNAEDFVAGAGGVFAPNCLDQPNLASFVADDAFTTAEFAGLAGGKFAVDCIGSAAAWQNLGAADSWTAAVILELIQDGAFAADAPTRALFGAGIVDATLIGQNAVQQDEIDAGAVSRIKLAGATSALDTNTEAPLYILSRGYNSASETAQDITIYSANSPAMEIVDVWLDPSTAEGAAMTFTLRDAAGGIGNAISSALDANSTSIQRTTSVASNILVGNSTLVIRTSGAVGTAIGTFHIMAKRTS